MKNTSKVALASAVLSIGFGSVAVAQKTAEPTYKGDPSVYKLIYEDANFRVIEAVRPKGVHDKVHSHGGPGIVYLVSDCSTKTFAADGKTSENTRKAGTVVPLAAVAAHSAENIGPADCKQVFIEKK